MDGVGLFSCHRFNENISINSDCSVFTTADEPCSSVHDPGAHSLELSQCDQISQNKPVCTSYDEDYEVNGDEEISTPRSSPTLLELRKLLDEFKPITSKNSRIHDRSDPMKASSNFILKSLKEVASRPCQYPLEKFYDEAIPVKNLQRSLLKNVRFNNDRPMLPEQVSISTWSLVSHPPVRRLDSITCPTSPLPRLSSCCSSSGSLIGNLNGIPMTENNLFLSDDLFPPTLSKSLYKETEQLKSDSNGYMDELYLDSACELKQSETDHKIDRDVSEDSGLYTPSDDASSPGTASCAEKANEHINRPTSSCFDSLNALRDSTTLSAAASDGPDPHLPVPAQKSSRSTLKSKHSKRSKASSCLQSDKPKIQEPSSDLIVDQAISPPVTDCTALTLHPITPSFECLSSVPPISCSVVTKQSVSDASQSHTIENGDTQQQASDNTSSHTSRSASASSHTYTQEDPSADGDFTLVTNKKSRRKQKFEMQQQERQSYPAPPPTINGPIPGVSNWHMHRPPLPTRFSSGTFLRGSFRRSSANGSTAYHRVTGTVTNLKPTLSSNQPMVSQKPFLYGVPCNSSNNSDGTWTSGQSDGSLNSDTSSQQSLKQQKHSIPRHVAPATPISSVAQPTLLHAPPSVNKNKAEKAAESDSNQAPISSNQHQILSRFLLSSWASFASQIAVS